MACTRKPLLPTLERIVGAGPNREKECYRIDGWDLVPFTGVYRYWIRNCIMNHDSFNEDTEHFRKALLRFPISVAATLVCVPIVDMLYYQISDYLM